MTRMMAVIASCLLGTGVLGFVDYLTGDYSLVIFYLIPIAGAAWFCGRWGGLGIAVCSGAIRILSDNALHGASMRSNLHYWNFSVEIIFFMIVATLVTTLKKALAKDDAL